METTKNLWAKVVVATYRGVPVVTEAIERLADAAACNSRRQDCAAAFEGVAEKLQRKNRLLNLKCIADDAVSALPPENAFIIRSRMDGMSFESIAAALKMSIRAVFRKYDAALVSITRRMKMKGFDDEWFRGYFGDDKYVMTVFRRYAGGEE
jgi:hypothetical protein